jgi:formaldehyde-activating enzyme
VPASVHHVPVQPLAARFVDIGLDEATVRRSGTLLGTGSEGTGSEAVQVDLLCGPKAGPIGDAWAYQLTYPRHGHEALTTILEPNLTVRPSTLIIPTNELRDLRQANMIYGPVQNAIAQAIVDRLANGTIPEPAMRSHVTFVLAAVHPQALDRHVLHRNAYGAACTAIDRAFAQEL